MNETRMTSKGQITVPKPVRDRLGLEPGDYLRFTIEEDGTVQVEPLDASGRPRTLAGWLNDRIAVAGPVDLVSLRRQVEAAVAEHVLGSSK
jgi:AbrB family looped-hinge helix DNA binding protein